MLVKQKRDRRVVFAARNRQHSLVVSIFTAMSIILAQTQKHREAELVQEKAQKIINSILRYVGYYEKAGALIALGEAITHTQHLEEARGAWKEAESLIEKIKDAGWRMERLSQLATALVEAREWGRSEAILGLIWMGNPSHGTIESLSQLAEALIEARDWERPEAILSIVISWGSTYDHTDAVDKLIKILIQ